jgi:hypothetical protein
MAHTAHDADNARVSGGRYFARWEACAFALGINVPDEAADDEAKRIRANAYKRVKDVRRELSKAGAIEQLGGARPGRTAEYLLTLNLPVDNSKMGDRESPPLGTERVPLIGTQGTERVPNGGPRESPQGNHSGINPSGTDTRSTEGSHAA